MCDCFMYWNSGKDTIIEELEEEIKTCDITSSYFRYKVKSEDMLLDISPDIHSPSFYQLETESNFEYLLFKLFCFFDMNIHDIYELIKEIGGKYHKNDLFLLSYYDFEKLSDVRSWNVRKEKFLKVSPEYVRKIGLKDGVVGGNIEYLVKDYEDTLEIMDCLNEDVKCICNDEDISPEKRLELIGKYSKISIRLNEKRFGLLTKIREEKL